MTIAVKEYVNVERRLLSVTTSPLRAVHDETIVLARPDISHLVGPDLSSSSSQHREPTQHTEGRANLMPLYLGVWERRSLGLDGNLDESNLSGGVLIIRCLPRYGDSETSYHTRFLTH